MELVLSLLLFVSDRIRLLGPVRLLDLGLIIIVLYTMICSVGRVKTSFKWVWILSIIRIIFLYTVLIFKDVTDISQFLSIGYFLEFLFLVYIAENYRIDFHKIWVIGYNILFINAIVGILQFFISGGSVRGHGFVGSASSAYALPFILYFMMNYKKISFYKKIVLLTMLVSTITSLQRTLIVLVVMGIGLYILMDRLSKKYRILLKRLLFLSFIILIFWIVMPDILKNTIVNKFLVLLDSSQNGGDSSIQTRYALWEVAVNLFLRHPVVGIGSGHFSRLTYSDFLLNSSKVFSLNAIGLSTHNNFLEYLCETGIIGTLLTYAICINIFTLFNRKVKKYKIYDSKYQSMYVSGITLTIYDIFGQGTFFPFWNYVVFMLILYIKCEQSKNQIDIK